MSLTYDVLKDDVRAGRPIDFGFVTYVPERTCRIVVNHGDHGPEPRFDGDVWTVHDACSECGWPMGRKNAYCPHCGAKVVDE